jgi:hypothetical protein
MLAELGHALPLGVVDSQKLHPIVIAGPIADSASTLIGGDEKGGVNSTATWSPGRSSAPANRAIPPSLKEVPLPSKMDAFMARETITRIGTLTL